MRCTSTDTGILWQARAPMHMYLLLISIRFVSSSLSSTPTLLAHHEAITSRRIKDETIGEDETATSQEWYMQLVCPLIFGLLLSLIGFVIGYSSYLEALLLKRYKSEGVLLRADVVSRKLVRGGQSGWHATADTAFYEVYVHYWHELTSNYSVKIRKRLTKVEEDELIHMQTNSQQMLGTESEDDSATGSVYISPAIDIVIATLPSDKVERQAHGTNHDNGGITCNLYVLPGFPRSGYPKMHVDRASSISSRLRTLCLVGVVLCIAGLCFGYSAHLILLEESTSSYGLPPQKIGLTTFIIVGALLALQLFSIPYCLHDTMQLALSEEYLENGDFLSIPRDDSTLSLASTLWSTGTADQPLTRKVSSKPSFQFLGEISMT